MLCKERKNHEHKRFDVYPLARISHMAKDEIEFLED